MSNTRKLVLLTVAVAIVGALVYTLTNRDNETGTATTEHTPPLPTTVTTTATPSLTIEVPASPDATAAEGTARQALSVAFTWYPATDRSPTDSYARAREWLTDSLAETLLVDSQTERGPGVQWSAWASKNTKVIADVTLGCSGCPPDTDTLIHRVASIHQTAITNDEKVTVTPDTTVWVTLTKSGNRWLVDTIHY